MVLIPPLDVVFVDTLGDINVYYTSDEPSTAGCCSAPLSNDDVKASTAECCSAPQSNVNVKASAAECCPAPPSNDNVKANTAECCPASLSNDSVKANSSVVGSSAPQPPRANFDANEWVGKSRY
jgi:hypothetical protein